MSPNSRPSIGLALSGSGSRLVFYIGFLEELKKADIPIGYIAACSGGSIVAASFACGTMEDLRDFAFKLNLKEIRHYLTKGKGGLYSFDGADELATRFTKNLKFEDVRPLMGFVAVDVESGEQIVLSMGDIYHALKVSCAVPAIMEPIKWGGRTLVDGGLLNIVPVDVLKQVGVDICVGINMRGNPHIFSDTQLTIRKFFNLFKKVLFIDYFGKVWGSFFPSEEFEDQVVEQPGMFTVLGKSLDLAIAASKKDYTKDLECDIMISPDVTDFGIKNFEEASQELYQLGRQTAIEYIPRMKEMLEEKAGKIRNPNIEIRNNT
jgi:predicted acylesterase/phospholipase RssA